MMRIVGGFSGASPKMLQDRVSKRFRGCRGARQPNRRRSGDTCMRTLELGKHRRARVWIGELPDAACPSINTLTHTVAVDRESQHGLTMAAIEVFVPLGPRSMYGLL